MQRAAFPELQGRPRPRRNRRPGKPDRVLVALKVATFLAAAGLVGVVILLVGAGRDDTAGRTPTPPRIGSPQPGDDAPATTTTPPTMIDPPALRTETSSIIGTPAPPRSLRPTTTPTTPDARFAVAGERCPRPGMFAFTREYQPVMCYSPAPNQPPRWHPVF